MHVYYKDSKKLGPMSQLITLAKEYDLFDQVKNAIESNVMIGKHEWKNMVKERVWDKELTKVSVVCALNKTLSLLSITRITNCMLSWWQYVQLCPTDMYKCKAVARLLLDCHKLKTCRFRYKEEGVHNAICEHCTSSKPEAVSHVLFECTENEVMRERLWNIVIQQCPGSLAVEMNSMDNISKTAFVLTGLNNSFIREWIEIYKHLLDFIYTVYANRIKLNTTVQI